MGFVMVGAVCCGVSAGGMIIAGSNVHAWLVHPSAAPKCDADATDAIAQVAEKLQELKGLCMAVLCLWGGQLRASKGQGGSGEL